MTGTARQSEQSCVPDGEAFSVILFVLRTRWPNEPRHNDLWFELLNVDRGEWVVSVELIKGVAGLGSLIPVWLALARHLLHVDPEW